MIDCNEAVFLPVDDRILNLFKGYVLNGKPLIDLQESDVYNIVEYYEFSKSKTKTERIFRFLIIVPLIPLFLLLILIASVFKKLDYLLNKINYLIDVFFNFLFKKKKELRIQKTKNEKYIDAIEEDIPGFLDHCKKKNTEVYLYSYRELTMEETLKVGGLINSGLITYCQIIYKLSDLISLAVVDKLSIQNSLLLIKDSDEMDEATLLESYSGNGLNLNVVLWQQRKLKSEGGSGESEWESHETIIGIKERLKFHLTAKNKTFFTNDSVWFIEDERDEFLNHYIQRNLSRINNRLEKKGMRFIYPPSFQKDGIKFHEEILQFVRYRVPTLYSLSNSELNSTIQKILQEIPPEEFYRTVLEELELPFFKRPCLLRNISSGSEDTENKFTHTPIEYKNEKELDKLFDLYIQQVKIPKDSDERFYILEDRISRYNTNWNLKSESRKDTEELIQKIDAIKEQGKYGVMVEAIIYMLAAIKEEKPDIINKVRPLLDKKKLLESKVVLSSIIIDKHYHIFLPDFGNIEVKMHALPKTVYMLFLRYPKGIRFKELYQYKVELLEIYNKVTNKYENNEIERAISDLVDMRKPNINIQCSRIRASFRNLMDEHIAKHYYIDGLNGEPKKITLPEKLIDIRY